MSGSRWALFASMAIACGGSREGEPAHVTPPGAPVAGSCKPSAAADIEVSSNDLNGFPPYATSGCSLVYVSRAGALVLRDLATGVETTIADASAAPRRPAISGDVIAWEAGSSAGPAVFVRAGGVVQKIEGPAIATEPRVSGSAVVFTGWPPAPADDADVWIYDATTRQARMIVGGPGQQRFADVSSRWVVASDFSEDPDGRYDGSGNDLSDIVVFDRASGAITHRRAPGKQAFPILVDGDRLAYLHWGEVHPEPKLVEYVLKSGGVVADPVADRTIATVTYTSREHVRPAASGGMLEWVANPDGHTTLHRAPADGSSPPVKAAGLDGLTLFAPAPTSFADGTGFTVVAAVPAGAAGRIPSLRAVDR
ncbi:MAG: hypothetical protein KF819_22255 [Labilithrix sp.]|nr:hypothetical protein [Labilithrix sp.]